MTHTTDPFTTSASRSVHTTSWIAVAAAALALAVPGAGPAHAVVDPGDPAPVTLGAHTVEAVPRTGVVVPSSCPLSRVMTTYVRCDDLTGNGVSAPAWILER
jgi:hypothetical protein